MILARLRSIGPSIVVASVVLGPGSLLVSSRIGCDHGYQLIWLLGLAAILMMAMTAAAARLGVSLPNTIGDEITARRGRPASIFVGVVLFLVVACFQFSNNVAIVAAVDTLFDAKPMGPGPLLIVLNVGMAMALFGLKRVYRFVEILMKLLVLVMVLGFLGNLFFTQPSLLDILSGLLPSVPENWIGEWLPSRDGETLHDPLLPAQALMGTTFSVAGAYYAAYLAREKGWKLSDWSSGLWDSMIGISVLALLTLTVMVSAAEVFHGRLQGRELATAADVAVQLEPLMGSGARYLFALGLLAGAFSSFLVNAMIGGTVLADGLGLGGDMNRVGPKVMTVLALGVGLAVALWSLESGQAPVRLIIFAQALTVLGNPILAAVLLWLTWREPLPRWIRLSSWVGFGVVLFLALRTAVTLVLKVQGS